jgi:hypothetical protein
MWSICNSKCLHDEHTNHDIYSVENIKTRVYVSIPRYGTCATGSGGAIHTRHSVLCEVIDHS